jgi:hypothetical protein
VAGPVSFFWRRGQEVDAGAAAQAFIEIVVELSRGFLIEFQ